MPADRQTGVSAWLLQQAATAEDADDDSDGSGDEGSSGGGGSSNTAGAGGAVGAAGGGSGHYPSVGAGGSLSSGERERERERERAAATASIAALDGGAATGTLRKIKNFFKSGNNGGGGASMSGHGHGHGGGGGVSGSGRGGAVFDDPYGGHGHDNDGYGDYGNNSGSFANSPFDAGSNGGGGGSVGVSSSFNHGHGGGGGGGGGGGAGASGSVRMAGNPASRAAAAAAHFSAPRFWAAQAQPVEHVVRFTAALRPSWLGAALPANTAATTALHSSNSNSSSSSSSSSSSNCAGESENGGSPALGVTGVPKELFYLLDAIANHPDGSPLSSPAAALALFPPAAVCRTVVTTAALESDGRPRSLAALLAIHNSANHCAAAGGPHASVSAAATSNNNNSGSGGGGSGSGVALVPPVSLFPSNTTYTVTSATLATSSATALLAHHQHHQHQLASLNARAQYLHATAAVHAVLDSAPHLLRALIAQRHPSAATANTENNSNASHHSGSGSGSGAVTVGGLAGAAVIPLPALGLCLLDWASSLPEPLLAAPGWRVAFAEPLGWARKVLNELHERKYAALTYVITLVRGLADCKRPGTPSPDSYMTGSDSTAGGGRGGSASVSVSRNSVAGGSGSGMTYQGRIQSLAEVLAPALTHCTNTDRPFCVSMPRSVIVVVAYLLSTGPGGVSGVETAPTMAQQFAQGAN